MTYFKIKNSNNVYVDLSQYVQGMKVSREALVSDKSGRNTIGTMMIDLIGYKYRIDVTFRPLTDAEAKTVCDYLGQFVMDVQFKAPQNNNALTSANCYIGTPNFEWYSLADGIKITKPMTLAFIER